MPKAKKLVMEQLDPVELRRAVHRAAVELQEPYRTFSPKSRGEAKSAGWTIIHVPSVGNRELVADGLTRSEAKKLKAFLETSWVNGRMAAMLD